VVPIVYREMFRLRDQTICSPQKRVMFAVA
jgi:hypothetical protein